METLEKYLSFMGGTEWEAERKFQTHLMHSGKASECAVLAWHLVFKVSLCINWQRQGRT